MADPTPAHALDPAPGPEDAKLATLARATRARTQAPAGAAVRDLDGRTYAAADVALASLHVVRCATSPGRVSRCSAPTRPARSSRGP